MSIPTLGCRTWTWFGWIWFVLWHINHWRLFNAKSILYMKTVLFQTIQFSIRSLFSSIWSTDRTLSVATTSGQSGPERVLCIPQSSSITWTLPSDFLVSYPVGWVLSLCREAVSVFYSPSRIGDLDLGIGYIHYVSLRPFNFRLSIIRFHVTFVVYSAVPKSFEISKKYKQNSLNQNQKFISG